jgi:hypothetical protein
VARLRQPSSASAPRRLVLGLSLLGLVACDANWTATPLPEPPALDGERIHTPEIMPAAAGELTIIGDPSSVSAGATLRILNLDTTDAPFTSRVEGDGSFELQVSADAGDELRIEAFNENGRSGPLDYLALQDGLVPSPRHDCVRLIPETTLEFGSSPDSADLVVQNRCDDELVLDNPRARLELPDFRLQSELPQTLAPNGSAALEFEFLEESAEAREDVFFVDIEVLGEVIRYPVTLSAPERR